MHVAQRSGVAGSVGVHGEDGPRRFDTLHGRDLALRQRRAHRSHDVLETELVRRHHVHVPLDNYRRPRCPDAVPSPVQGIEDASFIKNRRLGRVDVLCARLAV